MKLSCNLIKDLLIIYEDDACSDDSKKVVEEHLRDCPACSKYYQTLKGTNALISEEIKEALNQEDKVIKKGLKKIRRRWIASLVAVFMLLPLLGLAIMGYHEKHDEGIAFSNLDDIYRCMRYLKFIENKNFEKAAELVDFYQADTSSMSKEEYQRYMKERFIRKLQEYDELGIYIDNIRYDSSYRVNGDRWTICVAFDENYPDGSERKMIVHLNGETLYQGATSYPYISKTNMDDYIDEILNLYSEDDPLGYQNFEVTFELKEGEKAVIDLKNIAGNVVNLGGLGLFNITYGTGAPLFHGDCKQETFVTSVPGKYSICGVSSAGENVYLTVDDIAVEIISYN